MPCSAGAACSRCQGAHWHEWLRFLYVIRCSYHSNKHQPVKMTASQLQQKLNPRPYATQSRGQLITFPYKVHRHVSCIKQRCPGPAVNPWTHCSHVPVSGALVRQHMKPSRCRQVAAAMHTEVSKCDRHMVCAPAEWKAWRVLISSACNSSTDMLLRSSVCTSASDEYCRAGIPADRPMLMVDPSGTVARLG